MSLHLLAYDKSRTAGATPSSAWSGGEDWASDRRRGATSHGLARFVRRPFRTRSRRAR